MQRRVIEFEPLLIMSQITTFQVVKDKWKL